VARFSPVFTGYFFGTGRASIKGGSREGLAQGRNVVELILTKGREVLQYEAQFGRKYRISHRSCNN